MFVRRTKVVCSFICVVAGQAHHCKSTYFLWYSSASTVFTVSTPNQNQCPNVWQTLTNGQLCSYVGGEYSKRIGVRCRLNQPQAALVTACAC
jgi:hypothetical protein